MARAISRRFCHRYFRARAFPGNLAPTSGSMGYGFPASIAAKLEHPDRAVVCVAGDGDFQMTLNELSTARQYGANVVVIVCNNGQYGTIRMHQEKTYPGRVSGTQLFNPDYAALVQAYGGHGECVRATEEFAPALDRALNAGVPAVIELVLDPDRALAGVDHRRRAGLGESLGHALTPKENPARPKARRRRCLWHD